MLLDDFIFHSDNDECEQGTDGCDHNCTNTIGSYYCTCMDGYGLESDNQTCTGNNLLNIQYKCVYICMNIRTYIIICLDQILLQYLHICVSINHMLPYVFLISLCPKFW